MQMEVLWKETGCVIQKFELKFDADFHIFRILQDHVAFLILNENQLVSFLNPQDLRKIANEGNPILVTYNGFSQDVRRLAH